MYKGKGATGNPSDPSENNNINLYYFNKSTDVRRALSTGQYANLTIFYDSLEQKFSQIEYRLKGEVNDSTLGGDDKNDDEALPVPKELDQYISRLYTRISDHGTVGIGSDGLEASGMDQVDQAKSISRYNALFSQSLSIQVPCNTNLKVGDIINVVFPDLNRGQSKQIDDSMSGNYLISRLNHHMQPNASFSSLNLIRDSYGYASAYPTDISQSTGQLIEEDNERYGNTFPPGSFNITK